MSSEPRPAKQFTVRDETHLMSEETLAEAAALPPAPGVSVLFTTATYQSPDTERAMAEAMGIDYDAVLAYREEIASLPQPVTNALDAVRREVQRSELGL